MFLFLLIFTSLDVTLLRIHSHLLLWGSSGDGVSIIWYFKKPHPVIIIYSIYNWLILFLFLIINILIHLLYVFIIWFIHRVDFNNYLVVFICRCCCFFLYFCATSDLHNYSLLYSIASTYNTVNTGFDTVTEGGKLESCVCRLRAPQVYKYPIGVRLKMLTMFSGGFSRLQHYKSKFLIF